MANLFSGMFNGPQQNGFTPGDINNQIAKQQGNINDFSSQLASMRSQYLAQIPGLNQAAFSQFGANAQGQMGANGLTPNSGAFADALARQAIPMQANMINTGYQTGVQNANSVMGANTALSNSAMGVMGQGLSAPTQNPFAAGLGNLASAGIGAGMNYMLGPVGGTMAQNYAQMMATNQKYGQNQPSQPTIPQPQYTGNGTGMWRDNP